MQALPPHSSLPGRAEETSTPRHAACVEPSRLEVRATTRGVSSQGVKLQEGNVLRTRVASKEITSIPTALKIIFGEMSTDIVHDDDDDDDERKADLIPRC